MSLLLIPTSNVDLHNRPPPTKHKKIIRCLHPLASCLLHLLPRRHLTSYPLCLFVCPFVCVFGWLLHCLSAPCRCFPSRPVASPRHVVVLRCVSRRPSCLVVVKFSRRPVVTSSRHHAIMSCLASSLYCVPQRRDIVVTFCLK